MKDSATHNALSRRQFIDAAVATGALAFTGLSAWGAISWNERRAAKRRRAPDDGLSLPEYLEREAPKMDYFPVGLLASPDVRFRAALTFERYLRFYRYKERVISSPKEEIDDCVRQIDDFPPKTQALILAATVIFDSVWRSDPSEGHYASAYRRWRRRARSTPTKVKVRIPSYLPTDLDHYEERSYIPGKRPYYPYYYPVLAARPFLILGEPVPDPSVDKECWKMWRSVNERFELSKEVAFPALTLPLEESRPKENDETLRRLMKSPLRFLYFSEQFQSERPSDFNPEDLEIFAKKTIAERRQLEIQAQLKAQGENFDHNSYFWRQWLKNIDECVAIVRRELDLSIPPERWVSDYYPDAGDFLQKVAELEKDKSTPFERLELLTALREYWFSMQIDFDYDFYADYMNLPHGIEPRPFVDLAAVQEVTLSDVAYSFYPNC